ncbi:hypothetical protein F4801DRAFT_585271 [Xylaria longipes]|nr:hypothetical protein F4801DRAFT_585271 [Xylaria longipes]
MVRVGGLLAPVLSFSACLFVISLLPQAYGRSICGILDQRTAIVDDRLFFCSGNYTFDDDGLPLHTTPYIYWMYLNDTIDVSGPLDMALLGSADLPSESLHGGKNPDPGGFSGTFFYDHTTLYPYAGLVGPEADGINNQLWAFNSSNNMWNLVPVEGGKISFGSNSEGVYASDPQTGRSFYTGGWTLAYNSTGNGTVKFRSSTDENPNWDFQTFYTGIQGPNILKGAMVYVRKGQAGVLIAFGGYQTAYPGTEIPDFPWDQRPFSEIFIYDIYTSTWYHQTATGDLPDLRTEFCAAVSSAPDDSSFQITIHGGWDQLNRRAFNDVYVLSVPSFRWIKVEDTNNPDLRGSDQPGRNRHKCDMWNETSMFVMGGEITLGVGDTYLLAQTCNQAYPPVKVLDTSTYTWQTEFNPKLTYSVPGVVSGVIGGDSSGGAQVTEPELGWESEDLVDIFNRTVVRDTYIPPGRSVPATSEVPSDPANPPDPPDPPVPGSSSNPETPSNSEDPSDSNKDQNSNGLNNGAIAGIAVGGFAAIAGSAGILWAVFSRRSSRGGEKQAPDEGPPSVTHVSLVKRWHKPELDATTSQRYELDVEHIVHEVHGDDTGKWNRTLHSQQRQAAPTSLGLH